MAQHPSWTVGSKSAAVSEGNTSTSGAAAVEEDLSTCAFMVQYISALTTQPARSKHNNKIHESLYGDVTALRGYFKLVAQHVLYFGEEIKVEDLEDLEEACTLFRKKTTFVEVKYLCLLFCYHLARN